ncbi:MAG: LPS export ABC transporter ATP-binding protein [Elusimicrobia bacterium]|nr:LPS export ABC transporter ATP-binding protein [Elusimicrobiota bacterium]
MALRAEDLRKSYGSRFVVDGVSVEVHPGEIVGLLGPNGAGKTTSFYMTVGLVRPDGGRILIDDRDVSALPMYRRARAGLGYLAQEPSIFRRLSVEDNLNAILEHTPLSPAQRTEKRDRLLADLGLTRLAKQMAHTLSGGEKRRTEIARALTTDPRYLLLDEPFVGIDPLAVNDIQQVLGELKTRGLGLLITDHNVQATLEIVDRAYIIYAGKILVHGKAQELLQSAEARRVYLGEKFHL